MKTNAELVAWLRKTADGHDDVVRLLGYADDEERARGEEYSSNLRLAADRLKAADNRNYSQAP